MRIMKYFFLGLLLMVLLSFVFGLFDDAFKEVYGTGNWFDTIIGAFKYYFFWVLPYWWVIILIGTLVLGLVFFGLSVGIEKIRGHPPT